MEWQTIGHEHIYRLLEKQLAADAVAHAYLFVGPRGVGKHSLATEFARKVLDTPSSHLQPISFSFSDARLEQVRELTQRLSLRPQMGSRQVAILDEADQMSTAAANALLKTIEEPTASTVLILISHRDNVLPTIRSRCQTFQFGRLSAASMALWTRTNGVSNDSASALLSADGSPGEFLKQMQEAGVATPTAVASYVHELQSLLGAPISERLSFVSRWADDDVEAFTARIVAWLTLLYKQPELCKDITKSLSILLEAWRRLQTNANKKLVSEYVCINIA